MNYKIVYDQLMERAKGRTLNCYSEWHHINPKSLGGGDEPSNLAELTYREHYLAHWLLTKIYKIGRGRHAMIYAFQCMGTMGSGGRIIAAWQYEVAKKVCADFVFTAQPSQKNHIDARNQRIANRRIRLIDRPDAVMVIKRRHYRLKDHNA